MRFWVCSDAAFPKLNVGLLSVVNSACCVRRAGQGRIVLARGTRSAGYPAELDVAAGA